MMTPKIILLKTFRYVAKVHLSMRGTCRSPLSLNEETPPCEQGCSHFLRMKISVNDISECVIHILKIYFYIHSMYE